MQELVSIIIATLQREELKECLKSIDEQTYRSFEVIIADDKGPLAKIRNEGARRAKGDILVFIDDDVVCSKGWLQAIVDSFNKRNNLGGVSGPAVIPEHYRSNRDLFKHKIIKRFYDWFFLEGVTLPGQILRSGAFTTGATEPCQISCHVDYLEACNMAFDRKAFWEVNGFDEQFRGIGDWSEPDIAYRIRGRGYRLWFDRNALVEHHPSPSRSFKKKTDQSYRYTNYRLFSDRHIKPCFRHSVYKLFLKLYYGLL